MDFRWNRVGFQRSERMNVEADGDDIIFFYSQTIFVYIYKRLSLNFPKVILK